MKRLLLVYVVILVFCQIMKTDFLYAADWRGSVTVNNQTTWTKTTTQNSFASILNIGVDDQLFKKNRLSLNIFLPYRQESPSGISSYSPGITSSVLGKRYSLFTNYGVFTSSDQLQGTTETRREQASLNIFPKKLPSLFFSYNKNDQTKDASGDKGPAASDFTFDSSYTLKKITFNVGYKEQNNEDAQGILQFKNWESNWGATTSFQPLPKTSLSASYNSISNSSENFSPKKESSAVSDTTLLSISSVPFRWASILSSYSLTNTTQEIKEFEIESSTTSSNEKADATLTLIPYPKLTLSTTPGFEKQTQANETKTVDSISYGIRYETLIIRNFDASVSATHNISDDSTIGKSISDELSLSQNMLVHPRAEVKLNTSIGKSELPQNEEGKEKTETYSNSWTIGVTSSPTDKLDMDINYRTSGTSESFSVFKTISQSATANLRYYSARTTNYNVSFITDFSQATSITGSLSHSSRLLRTITISYSNSISKGMVRDSFVSQVSFNLRGGTRVQINYRITPLFTTTDDSGRTTFLGIILTKKL